MAPCDAARGLDVVSCRCVKELMYGFAPFLARIETFQRNAQIPACSPPLEDSTWFRADA